MNSDTNSNIEVPSTKHDPNNQTNNHQQQQNQNLPLPPPPVDDNYAVTELWTALEQSMEQDDVKNGEQLKRNTPFIKI